MYNNQETILFTMLIVLAFLGCKQSPSQTEEKKTATTYDVKERTTSDIVRILKNPDDKRAIVIAHRGDWRNAPENSIQAIENCIKMGVDAVEIDIRETKDGILVLMHDETLERTTNGKGRLENITLDSLRILHLKNGAGVITTHRVPTLEEALLHAKGKILLDLDIKSVSSFEKLYTILKQTGTVGEVFTGSYKYLVDARNYYGTYLDSILYFPAISEKTVDIPRLIYEFESSIDPSVYIPKFTSDTSRVVSYIDSLKTMNNRVWVHTITASRSGGHHDDRAVSDLEGSYGWLVDRGVNVFQTDRPELLLNYLRKKGLHD